MGLILARIPVVGGVAYRERLGQLPATFEVTLRVEPDNRYFQHAIAVLVNGEKIGYVAPEIGVNYYDTVAAAAPPVTCAGRRGSQADHGTSGIEVLLDFSSLPVQTHS
ncbi:MAG: HIRAN domain-containing protein [Acidobacteria bacterium]|nr:HIRAN domain-containing protein [Acidobacteriota bacterium]